MLKSFVEMIFKALTKQRLEKVKMVTFGYFGFESLVVGYHIGLFDFLHRQPNSTLQQIKDYLKLSEGSVRALLLACCAFGLIVKNKKRGTYRNDVIYDRLAVRESPNNILPMLDFHQYIIYRSLFDLEKSVKEGRNTGLELFTGPGNTLYDRLSVHPDLQQIFHDGMQCISKTTNPHFVSNAKECKRLNHLVDVGGGDGTNCIALVKQYPNLKATIFDLPTVCELAKKEIQKEGLSEKISVHPGNFFEDPFPSRMDGISYCHMANIYGREKNQLFFKKCHDALPGEGVLMLFQSVSNDDETGDIAAGAMSLYFLAVATGEGSVYSVKDNEDRLKTAGFSKIKHLRLPFNHALITGIK